MGRTNYQECYRHILKWEGGYVDHPRDPGGATNLGITRATLARHRGRPVSKQDVRDLTHKEAGAIYLKRYWNKLRADDLPDGLDLVAFDAGVNSGPARGAKWLQRALGVIPDGYIGPATLISARQAGDRPDRGVEAIKAACAARMSFLRRLRTWSTFGKGWSRRVASTEAEAVAMASRSLVALETEEKAASASSKRATTKAAASPVAAGGGIAIPDLPDWSMWLCVGGAGIVVVILTYAAVRHSRRATAYRAKIEEMQDE